MSLSISPGLCSFGADIIIGFSFSDKAGLELCVVEDDFKLLILPHPAVIMGVYHQAVREVLRLEPMAVCMPGRETTN